MKRICRLCYWLVPTLLLYACATHFGGVRFDEKALYTARSFLVGTQAEQTDFGLYSYLLFERPPTPQNKNRYQAAVRAFLAQTPAPASDEYLPHGNLNILYLLLTSEPGKSVNRCLRSHCHPIEDEVVTAILRNYNYTRAKIMLRRIPGDRGQGPLIVTTTEPLSPTLVVPPRGNRPEALVQDLSRTPPHLVDQWMGLFIKKATGEGSGFKKNLRTLLLHMRTTMDVYAEGLPKVFNACILYLEMKKRFNKHTPGSEG